MTESIGTWIYIWRWPETGRSEIGIRECFSRLARERERERRVCRHHLKWLWWARHSRRWFLLVPMLSSVIFLLRFRLLIDVRDGAEHKRMENSVKNIFRALNNKIFFRFPWWTLLLLLLVNLSSHELEKKEKKRKALKREEMIIKDGGRSSAIDAGASTCVVVVRIAVFWGIRGSCESAELEKRFPPCSPTPKSTFFSFGFPFSLSFSLFPEFFTFYLVLPRLGFHYLFFRYFPLFFLIRKRNRWEEQSSLIGFSSFQFSFFFFKWRSEIMLRAWNRRRGLNLSFTDSCFLYRSNSFSFSLLSFLPPTVGQQRHVLSSSFVMTFESVLVASVCGWMRALFTCAFFLASSRAKQITEKGKKKKFQAKR